MPTLSGGIIGNRQLVVDDALWNNLSDSDRLAYVDDTLAGKDTSRYSNLNSRSPEPRGKVVATGVDLIDGGGGSSGSGAGSGGSGGGGGGGGGVVGGAASGAAAGSALGPWGALGGGILGALLPMFMNRGASKAQDQALSQQLDLARTMANLATKQANLDLPFRQNLYSALQARQGRQTPRFLPQGMVVNNPYQNVRQPASQGTGGNSMLAQALMQMIQQSRGAASPSRFDPLALPPAAPAGGRLPPAAPAGGGLPVSNNGLGHPLNPPSSGLPVISGSTSVPGIPPQNTLTGGLFQPLGGY